MALNFSIPLVSKNRMETIDLSLNLKIEKYLGLAIVETNSKQDFPFKNLK